MISDYKTFALESAEQEDGEIILVSCPETGIDLYYAVDDTDKLFIFESFGDCVDCGFSFHTSAMPQLVKVGANEWPVHYAGAYCSNCYSKDDDVKLTEEEVKALTDSEHSEDEEE